MTLSEKITQIYPELAGQPLTNFGIIVQNDSDGKGDYIAKWEHLTLAKPTDAELNG
jgi:hypothetical protein